MFVKVITVGGKSDPNITTLIDEYTKRLPRTVQLQWQFIKHGQGNSATSMAQEAENILKALPPLGKVLLLDETGQQLSSPALSKKLFSDSQNVSIIIGGAYGVDDSIKQRADFIWSLSDLVFPHQIVRLILAEQIYRAYTISINHPYHHS